MYEKGKGDPPQTEVMTDRPFSRKGTHPSGWKPLYRGEGVHRYHLEQPTEFVRYGPWLAAPREPELFESPKILMRRTDDRLMACIETHSAICVNSCHVIKLDASGRISDYYLLGILNSRLVQKVFELQNPQMVGKVFAEIKVVYVERLPIRTIDPQDPKQRRLHDRLVDLVKQMLSLQTESEVTVTNHEKEALDRQIHSTDRKIDQIVYELYGLTEEEIRIVEEATA